MEAHTGSHNPEVVVISPEEFGAEVSTYPKGAQEQIASLSSLLLEPDILAKIKQTPGDLTQIHDDLRREGLSGKEVSYVFRFFELPALEPKTPQKNGRER